MKIKSSQELVAEALTQIETLDAEKAKLMTENDECTLIDIRYIREIWKHSFKYFWSYRGCSCMI